MWVCVCSLFALQAFASIRTLAIAYHRERSWDPWVFTAKNTPGAHTYMCTHYYAAPQVGQRGNLQRESSAWRPPGSTWFVAQKRFFSIFYSRHLRQDTPPPRELEFQILVYKRQWDIQTFVCVGLLSSLTNSEDHRDKRGFGIIGFLSLVIECPVMCLRCSSNSVNQESSSAPEAVTRTRTCNWAVNNLFKARKTKSPHTLKVEGECVRNRGRCWSPAASPRFDSLTLAGQTHLSRQQIGKIP